MQHTLERYIFFEKLKNSPIDEKIYDMPLLNIMVNDTKMTFSFNTTPQEIAKKLYGKNSHEYIVAKVNGQLYDMTRPLKSDAIIEFLTFDSPQGKQVFWNSSSYLLAMCCEKKFGCQLALTNNQSEGFFYDIDFDTKITFADLNEIQNFAKVYVRMNTPFEQLEVTKENLLLMFKDSPYKLHYINEKITDGTTAVVYRCGDLVDLSLHPENIPNLPHVGLIKEFQFTNLSSSYWLGSSKNKSLTRIHGVSFPNKKYLEQWNSAKELIAARDHRIIGKNQKLFFFDEYSPGSCFFYPHGTIIYNKLIDFIKSEYRKRGFLEVITPNIYDTQLWKISGHWEHYQDNMFKISNGNNSNQNENLFAIKPMNCPGHCVMFASMMRSYRELPIRYADFGVLHRNELHGALSGLTRVRRFQQDDAHIFCEENQVENEINSCIDFMKNVYETFGFKFTLALSTKPESYVGSDEMWQKAELQLEKALNNSNFDWIVNLGDGAFYGPKIDITIEDAIGRKHQCATIQLDFNLPSEKCFNLIYQKPDGSIGRPVIIHRAILGSVERMMAILIESYAGKWPFWLSPRQICIIPVDKKFNSYAEKIYNIYHSHGFCVETDVSSDKLAKKIRNAQVQQFNFIFVVGCKEENTNTVNIRTRESEICGTFEHADVITKLNKLNIERSIQSVF
jgi:threonyl-tRNA synthetase